MLRRNIETPKLNEERLRAVFPRIQDASRRLQNVADVRNDEVWPIPILRGAKVDPIVYAVNAAVLDNAIKDCAKYYVDMNRSSERGEIIDMAVKKLEKRKIKSAHASGSNSKGKNKQNEKADVSTKASSEEVPIFVDTPTPSEKSEDDNVDTGSIQGFRLPRQHPQFPNPQLMAGTFTDAICQYEDFTVKPMVALTLKDITPSMFSPSVPRCILLKHFEVGLDSVEGIITGEVVIPETLQWRKEIREDRLGRLGKLKTGLGEYSKELEAHQRRCGHGQGRWIFYGIKFKQSYEEKKGGQGKWICFGAPLEAIQCFEPTHEQIAMGGGRDEKGNELPTRFENLIRTSDQFSLGGVACMDLWEGAQTWDNGVWLEVRSAMANTSLVVTTLGQTKALKGATTANISTSMTSSQESGDSSFQSSSPFKTMDGSAEVKVKRKRKCSTASSSARKTTKCKKTKG